MLTRFLATLCLGASALGASPAWADEPPGGQATPGPRTEWRSPPVAITGMMLTGFGLTTAAVGTVIYVGDDCDRPNDLTYCTHYGRGIGTLGWISGGVLVAVGVPMIVSGVSAVDVEGGRPMSRIQLTASPTRADLVVSF